MVDKDNSYLHESVLVNLLLGETIGLRRQVMEQQRQVSLKLFSLTFLTKRGCQGSLRLVINGFLLNSVSMVSLLLRL